MRSRRLEMLSLMGCTFTCYSASYFFNHVGADVRPMRKPNPPRLTFVTTFCLKTSRRAGHPIRRSS